MGDAKPFCAPGGRECGRCGSSFLALVKNHIFKHLPRAVAFFLLLFVFLQLLLGGHRRIIYFILAAVRARNFKNANPGSGARGMFFRAPIRGGGGFGILLFFLGRSLLSEEGRKD